MFIIFLPTQYAIQMQLLGGIWIIHTFPAVIFGLYTRWLDSRALLIGWFVGMISGTWMAASIGFRPIYPLSLFGITVPAYIAVYSFIFNLVTAVVLTLAFNALARQRHDETSPADYYALEGAGHSGH